ncbi:diadenylate cyclase CdaA [Candidatus Latescibacterota bacterium]
MELFKIVFLPVDLLDIVDIAIVALIFYVVYLRIKDTRAMQLITGLLIILVVSLVAGWARLKALNALFLFFSSVWLIGIVVIFAPEFRRLLIHMRPWSGMGLFQRQQEKKSIEEVVTAARRLSENQYGALIVMTRNTQLGVVVDTGTQLNSEVSHQLLVTIFTPGTPLHDLAVVIRSDRIAAANCLLPLSETRDIDRALGSRHRAALGITEETDAIVVVVSEETRAISLAVDGKLIRNLSPAELRNNLIPLLS